MELKIQATPIDIQNELWHRHNNLPNPIRNRHVILREHMYWVTKDGKKKTLLEMTTNHLNNIVKMKPSECMQPDGSLYITIRVNGGMVGVTQTAEGVMGCVDVDEEDDDIDESNYDDLMTEEDIKPFRMVMKEKYGSHPLNEIF